MRIDTERVLQKIAFINEQIDDINHLTSTKKYVEISNNKLLIKGIKYSLQTAIEAMIDIAFHIVSKQYSYAPEDARDAFLAMKKNGIINDTDYRKYSLMVGFRNRMVHLYHNVSDERVYEFSVSNLKDFDSFTNTIKSLLDKTN